MKKQDLPFVEEGLRLSESFIWKRQMDFYKSAGIDAWKTGTVPSRITTNAYIARTYARMIASYVRDLNLSEVTIIEGGAGHVRLGFLCVQHLQELQDAGLLPVRKWRYVLTDIAERNIEFWLTHEGLQPYFKTGVLDVARYEAGDSEITLRVSGDTVSARRPASGLVVIGNYFFDSLPIDVFQVDDQKLYEYHPQLTVLERDSGDSSSVADITWQWDRVECVDKPYDCDQLNHVVSHFRRTYDNTCFTVPVAGARGSEILVSFRAAAADRRQRSRFRRRPE